MGFWDFVLGKPTTEEPAIEDVKEEAPVVSPPPTRAVAHSISIGKASADRHRARIARLREYAEKHGMTGEIEQEIRQRQAALVAIGEDNGNDA